MLEIWSHGSLMLAENNMGILVVINRDEPVNTLQYWVARKEFVKGICSVTKAVRN